MPACDGSRGEAGGSAVILVVGGRGQGKLDYVRKRYGIDAGKIGSGLDENRVIYGLQEIVRRLVETGCDPLAEVLRHAEGHPDAIYICDEVGCGVVPVASDERQWREAVGRVCTALAERAEGVERVFCGIAMTIK